MNDDVPWIYVVMIFIAFLSWVGSRIKEAKESRQEKMIAKRAEQEARNSTRTQKQPPPSPYRPAERKVAAPAPVPEPEPEVPRTFRELFEMLQEQAPGTESPPPAQKPAAPPPLPSETFQDTLSAEDRLFYGTPKPKAVKPAPPIRVERIKGKTSSNLKEILKTRGTLREALILKEILDTPVSIKE